jgi:ATP-dependent DNA ligase
VFGCALVYYAFDLLSLEGTDLRDRPLLERRKLLAKLLKNALENIRFSEELQGTREERLELAHKFGLEGRIAKRPDSHYEPGRPFINLPEKRRGRFGQGITAAIMKHCHWVEPLLVAQVKFIEWTLDDQLRSS